MQDDLISKQAAIDALCSKCTVDKPETCSTIQKGDNWCEEVYILQNVPSVQPEVLACGNGELVAKPEPHEGHWIWVAGDLECSECHTRYPDLYPDYADSVACPHCGAHMKGERQK